MFQLSASTNTAGPALLKYQPSLGAKYEPSDPQPGERYDIEDSANGVPEVKSAKATRTLAPLEPGTVKPLSEAEIMASAEALLRSGVVRSASEPRLSDLNLASTNAPASTNPPPLLIDTGKEEGGLSKTRSYDVEGGRVVSTFASPLPGTADTARRGGHLSGLSFEHCDSAWHQSGTRRRSGSEASDCSESGQRRESADSRRSSGESSMGEGDTPMRREIRRRKSLRRRVESLAQRANKLTRVNSFWIMEREQKKKRYMLDARGTFFRYWDAWTGILLVFTAIVTPFELSFLEASQPPYVDDPLFLINRVVDLSFFADMAMQFFLPYQDSTGVWVSTHYRIVKHYLTTWFVIDLLSVLPFDLVEQASGASTKNMKMMRLLRLMRLVKLLRLLRSSRLLQRWESSLQIDYSVLDLQKFVVGLSFVAHCLACGWRLVAGTVRKNGEQDNWYTIYSGGEIGLDSNVWSLYAASLYWAVTTLSTVGYGDIIPVTDEERCFSIFGCVLGSSLYAYMVGAVCGLLASMNEENAKFYKTVDHLNAFMRSKSIPRDLQMRLRDYFRFKQHHGQTDVIHSLLTRMSPLLRKEVAEHLNSKWIKHIPFFHNIHNPDFYTELSMALQPVLFSASEVIIKENEIANKMYIVEKGVIASNGRICTVGKVFGVDMIGATSLRRRNYIARALTNSAVLSLNGDTMDAILANYKDIYKALRRKVVRSLCRDAIMRYTAAVRRVSGLRYSTGDLLLVPNLDRAALHPELLKMLMVHQVTMIKQEDPDRFAKINSAACIVQKYVRRFTTRKQVQSEIHERRQLTAAQLALVHVLDRLDMSEHRATLISKHELDLCKIKKLSALDLYMAADIPLGRALDLLELCGNMVVGEERERAGPASSSAGVEQHVRYGVVGGSPKGSRPPSAGSERDERRSLCDSAADEALRGRHSGGSEGGREVEGRRSVEGGRSPGVVSFGPRMSRAPSAG